MPEDHTTPERYGQLWLRPMGPRDPDEDHRAATPLELFFDLVFVVAIAQAATGLHHAVAEAHFVDGIVGYALAFFGIWWAWVNFTWFASAYDVDDVAYRILVFVQLTGALIFAAGVPDVAELDLAVPAAGYVVMRIALVLQWIRAARADPPRRATALRYAVGVAVLQAGWVALVFVPRNAMLPGFVSLAILEMALPAWAESATSTPWHPHHISERYGLLTIIVLGESILAATLAIQSALAGGETFGHLVSIIGGGLLTLYCMWWLYFDRPAHELLTTPRRAFVWGYGHYLIFAAAAAVGAGLGVATDVATDHAAVGIRVAGAAVAVPVALYLVTLWFLHHRPRQDAASPSWVAPFATLFVLTTPLTPSPVLATGLVLTALLALKLWLRHRVAVAAGTARSDPPETPPRSTRRAFRRRADP